MPACLQSTPIGPLLAVSNGAALTHLLPPQDPREAADDLCRAAAAAIDAFFAAGTPLPPLPCAPAGTPFQRRVWQALSAIPRGTTVTYAALAASLSLPRAARAVGQAVGRNPLLLLIPCHRVVAKDGPGGFLLSRAAKEMLLRMEGGNKADV